MRQKILVVTVEPLWPATHGGRVRTGKIVEALADSGFEVRVAYPDRPGVHSGPAPLGVEQVGLMWSRPGAFKRLTWSPWLGVFALPQIDGLQAQLAGFQPDFIYWSHSYLAAVGFKRLATSAYQIVEFANIERDRFWSISKRGTLKHRASAFVEFLKACMWERQVAREANLCVAISETDQKILDSHNGESVLVENALPVNPWHPSTNEAIVLSVANWDYGPNREGITYFLETEWQAVLAAVPSAKLVLAGSGSIKVADDFSQLDNIVAVGFADDLTELFKNSTVFLAPARSGAGRQLKVAEALGHARTIVGPPFLRRENRPGLPDEALKGSNDVAGEIIRRIQNVKDRHEVEKSIAEYAIQHDWKFETESLRRWMKGRKS